MALQTLKKISEKGQESSEELLRAWSEPRILIVDYGYVDRWLGRRDYPLSKTKRVEHIGSWIVSGGSYARATSLREVSIRAFIPSKYAFQIGDETVVVPRELRFLEDVVQESRYILDLPDNWDDEGSEPYTFSVWNDAVHFLIRYATSAFEKTGKVISRPRIYHAGGGSIDILWKTDKYRLLINILPDSQVASFYGDNYGDEVVKGTFNLNTLNLGLLLVITSI